MKTFLDHIVEDLRGGEVSSFREKVFVFPNRRAGIYFRNKLLKEFADDTFWSPDIFSIEDFVIRISGKSVPSDIVLLFELFSLYQEKDPGLSFDKFYSWGRILLNDFNEVDQNLVDADLLYRNLQDIREIEEQFGKNEEIMAALAQFSKVITSDKKSRLLVEFMNSWNQVSRIYHAFREHLSGKGMAYTGMIYRNLVEEWEKADVPYDEVVFAGFNSFTKSEEKLVQNFIDAGIAKVYWDADSYYMDDERDPAADNLRRYRRKWKSADQIWVQSDFESESREINIVGTAQSVGQAKIAGNIIGDGIEKETLDPTKTAIVLADENLLFPVLHSLPGHLETFNVTMGYPMRQTALFALVGHLIRIHGNKRGKGDKVYYKGSDLVGLFQNAMIRFLSVEGSDHFVKWVKRNKLNWVKSTELMEELKFPPLRNLFTPVRNYSDTIRQLKELMIALYYRFQDHEPKSLEKEFIYGFMLQLNQMEDTLRRYRISFDPVSLLKIIRESFYHLRVPFTGEPLEGLQVMGFLETRALDFETVIVLSANENKLPASRNRESYIPYALRKTFGLPAIEEHDAVWSYHLKRMLQRAKNIYLVYDTEVNVDGSGEKSRFLRQLSYRFRGHDNIRIREFVVNTAIDLGQSSSRREVEKNAQIITRLKELAGITADSKMSPTSLTTYLDCQLRFYFKYIAGIREPLPLPEEIDARDFGSIVHDVLEKLYEEYQEKTLTKEDRKVLLESDHIPQLIDGVFREKKFAREDQFLEGRNLLNKSIMIRLIRTVVENDLAESPFKILALESGLLNSEYELPGVGAVRLGGKVDRIDEIGQGDHKAARIIDYKTGKLDLISDWIVQRKPLNDYLEMYFTDGRFKAGFQAYFYSLLFRKKFPEIPLKAGILGMKEISRKIQYLRNGDILTEEVLDGFDTRLRALLQEIFDPEKPFVETDDRKKCTWCPYRTICGYQ